MFKDVFEMSSSFSANSNMLDDYAEVMFRFTDDLADIQVELQVSPVEEAAKNQYRRLGEYLIKIGEAFKKEDNA